MPQHLDQIAPSPKTIKPVTEVEKDFGATNAVVTTRSRDIHDLDGAIKEAKVDLSVWKVKRWVVNSWETTMSGKKSSTKTDQTYTNFQVKVWLEHIGHKIEKNALEKLLQGISKARAKVKCHPPVRPKGHHLVEISLFDAHFGMYAWGQETGNDYNLEIARERYAVGVDDLLNKTAGFAPERIIFPVGNDFFHINNPEGVTPKGHNRLDVDTRLAKVLEVGCDAVVRGIENCRRVAPVQVLWVPGNHDPETSMFLCLYLRAYFRQQKDVVIDISPKPRKYVHYGVNLIGYTHGDEESHRDLPNIMAGECREVWSTVRHCEWHLGHFHKRKETRFNTADTYGSVIVRISPALTSTDGWHFKKGYVQGHRTAEAYVFNRDVGFVAQISSHLEPPKQIGAVRNGLACPVNARE